MEIRDITYSGISASMEGSCQQIVGHLIKADAENFKVFLYKSMGQIFLRRVKNATKKEKTCRKRMSPQTDSYYKHRRTGNELISQLLQRLIIKPLIWTPSIVGANGDM